MSKEEKKYDIEDRLIDFAIRIIKVAESLPKTKTTLRVSLFGVEQLRHPIMVKHKEQNPDPILFTK